MNRKAVAKELLVLAKELVGIDFPTQDAYDKYMKEHPDADRSNHKVVETKKDAPAKKEPAKKSKPLPREEREQIENTVRDHLSGTGRETTKENMQSMFRTPKGKKLTDEQFGEIWDDLVKDGYLKKSGSGYRWNDEGTFDKAD